MIKIKNDKTLKVAKELHVFTIQTFIKTYSKLDSICCRFVYIHWYVPFLFVFLSFKFVSMENLSKLFVIGNVVKGYCHNLDFHILPLESNHEVINQAFQSLFESNFFEEEHTFKDSLDISIPLWK